jgi:siroheme synthase
MNSGTNEAGCVWLVGAGPGDPKLLTIRGKECLEQADVVLYDHLANPELLKYASPQAERIYVGRKGRKTYRDQAEINALLIDRAKEGKKVVRLKGGGSVRLRTGRRRSRSCGSSRYPLRGCVRSDLCRRGSGLCRHSYYA